MISLNIRKKIPAFPLLVFFIVLFFTACESEKIRIKKHIRKVESNLLETISIKGLPLKKMSLLERMKYYRIPGLSIAVLNNFHIEWTKGYGVTTLDSQEPITETTLFLSGEFSQSIGSLGALYFVEKNIFKLDEDINDYLKTWKVPAFKEEKNKTVSLRHLLSHSSGANLFTLEGYKQDIILPSLEKVLKGKPNANNPPFKLTFIPGSRMRSSWGGYAVLQLALTDSLKKSYSKIMKEIVLDPLGLENTTFTAPNTLESSIFACGHNREGTPIEGGYYQQAIQAASGLWTTPSDMAKFILLLSQIAKNKAPSIISTQTARKMLTPVKGNMGLGLFIDDSGENLNINNKGAVNGFQCYLIFYPERGQGAVIMTNSSNGQFLIEELLRSLSLTYSWPHFRPRIKPFYRLDPWAYKQYVGKYEVNSDYSLNISYEDYYLIVQPTGQAPTRFYVENLSTFYSTSPFIQIFFNKDDQNRVVSLVLKQAGQEQLAKKID